MLLLPEKASWYCISTTSLPPILPKFLRLGSQIFELLHHEVAVGVLFDSEFVLYQLVDGQSPVQSQCSAFDVE